MTYDEMVALLSRGKDKDGKPINVKQFDRRSAKSLADLYQEVSNGEATLRLNPETGRIERHATSVKITIEARGYELCEVGRVYLPSTSRPESIRIMHPEPLPGCSETGKPGENEFETGVRCLLEEWGVERQQFTIISSTLGPVGAPANYERDGSDFMGVLCYDYLRKEFRTVNTHESKAYFGVLSIVKTTYLRLIMPRVYFRNGRKIKDFGQVQVLLKWFKLFVDIDFEAAEVPR